MRDKAKFVWTDEIQDSFETVKKLIAQYMTLSFFDPCKLTIVTTDASDSGISGVLSENDVGEETIIPCVSRT